MSIELRIAGLIIAFLLFAIVGLYHVVRMMNRHQYSHGGMYSPQFYSPQFSSSSQEEKSGIPTSIYLTFFVIAALVFLVLPDEFSSPLDNSFDENNPLQRVVVMPATTASFFDRFSLPLPAAKNEPRIVKTPKELSSDLVPFGNERHEDTSQKTSSINTSPVSTPLHHFGYQVKCGSIHEFATKALQDYQKKFPKVAIYKLSGDCPYKVILFAATTSDEVLNWSKKIRNLPKGYIVSLRK